VGTHQSQITRLGGGSEKKKWVQSGVPRGWTWANFHCLTGREVPLNFPKAPGGGKK